jgi:hypothetical protein
VTGLEFGLVDLREVYAGQLMWPLELAPAVLAAFREWTAGLPDELAATIKLVRFPPIPDIPEPLRGRELVAVGLSFLGGEDAGRELVAPMRAAGPTYMDTVQTIPASGLAFVAGDPPNPVPGRGDGALLRDVPDEAADVYLELAGPGARTPLLFVELRALGGALTRAAPEDGPAGSLDAAFLAYGVGMVISPESNEAVTGGLAEMKKRFAPWTADRTLLNFAENQPGLRASFPAETADRLARVKATYDPDGVILGNHAVD